MRAIYTPFVIVPEIGQVIDAVDNSPTAPDSGCHSETSAVKVREGLPAETIALVGLTMTVVVVPSSG
jgi:hypothetical protein